jgi:hypothetical protein
MKKIVVLFLLISGSILKSQTVPIYIYFASHNETDDETYHGLNYGNSSEFATMKSYVQKVCDTISYYGASYEMMLESNFILGALSNDNAYTLSNDIIEWADNQPNIEVQSHNHFDPTGLPPNPYNSTDLVYLLDSCGVDTAEVLGGYIWRTFPGPVPEDWTQWQTPQPGAVFSAAPDWMPTLLWGGGSPMHTDDFEAYGIWRPSAPTLTGFDDHNPSGALVNFGNGCGQEFVIDDTSTAIQTAYRVINFVDSLHAHYDGDPNAFFNMKIMFNFRYLPDPGYIDKIGTVLSTIDPYIQAGRMEYKGIMDIYQEWMSLHPANTDYFISVCDTTVDQSIAAPADLGNEESMRMENFTVYPNPASQNLTLNFSDYDQHQIIIYDFMGQILLSLTASDNESIDVSNLPTGMYLIVSDQIDKRIFTVE